MDEKEGKTPIREDTEREIRQRMERMSYTQLRRLLAFARGMETKTKRSGL